MSALMAPAMAVPPLIATDQPRPSNAAPSEAVTLAVSVMLDQPETGFTNT